MYNHPMRRSERELSSEQAAEILHSGSWGVLSTIGADGYPYGVPVNYVYCDEKIYFHCARNSGHKQENLIFSGKVSFTVVDKSQVDSKSLTTMYRSAIAFGVAAKTVIDKEKALRALVKKYSPDFIQAGEREINLEGANCDIFVIEIEKLSAKSNIK